MGGRDFSIIGRRGGGGGVGNPLGPQFYASPAGGGNGLTPQTPFQISNFWGVATPGATLNLLGVNPATDGHYTGANSMIRVAAGISGNAANRIYIRALNDGGVDIDGQGANQPLSFSDVNANYIWFEGFDIHGSLNTSVVTNHGANNYYKRICAWDAPINFNAHVWEVTGDDSIGTIIEDCAGFGLGRKIFSTSQGATTGPSGTVYRRCWGRFQGSTNVGPKEAFVCLYHSVNTTIENCIGTWSGESQPAKYTAQNNGNPNLVTTSATNNVAIGLGSKTLTLAAPVPGWTVPPPPPGQSYVMAVDAGNVNNWMEGPVTSNSGTTLVLNVDNTNGSGTPASWNLYTEYRNNDFDAPVAIIELGSSENGPGQAYGCLSYILATDPHVPGANGGSGSPAVWGNEINGAFFTSANNLNPILLQDCVDFYPNGVGSGCAGAFLHNGTASLTVTRYTHFQGNTALGNDIQNNWVQSNIQQAANPAALYTGTGPHGGPESLYNTSHGAELRFRYQNGVLGSVPLWPWPMSARIKAATTRAGYSIADVDAAIQSIFGTYPTY